MKQGQCTQLLREGVNFAKLEAIVAKLHDDPNWSRAVMDAKIRSGGFNERPKRVPQVTYLEIGNPKKHLFSPRFFAKLALFQSVELKVNESRSSLRRTCYGFRDDVTRERIYLRLDSDSLVVFRDSPAGFLTAKRYYIPGIKFMRRRTWVHFRRVLDLGVIRMGIRLTKYDVAKHYSADRPRYKLALMLSWRRKKFLEGKKRVDKKADIDVQAESRHDGKPRTAASS